MRIKSNKLWQKLYFSSPNIFKNIFASIYSSIVASKKYGQTYKKWRILLKESNYWDLDKLNKFRENSFKSFINEVITFSGFYNNIIKNNNICINDIQLADLNRFPIINKSIVIKNYNDIVNPKYKKNKYKFSSSGTTGTLLNVYLTPDAYQREYAFRWHFFSEFNVSRKDRFCFFIGSKIKEIEDTSPPFHIFDYYENSIFLSIFHMSETNLPEYIKIINKRKPKYIKGYPSALFTIASFIQTNKLNVSSPLAIFTASEVLHDYQKKVIEDAFKCNVYEWYGQVETTLNIHECRFKKLHVMEEYGYLEILDDSGFPVKSGEMGNAVVTGWGNTALPLIRYDTGDNVTLSKEQTCKCGRTGRIIESIDGRDEDIIITPEGKHIGRLTFIFMAIDNVKESQIIQKSINEITIKVVPYKDFSDSDKQFLVKKMHEYLGASMKIDIEVVPMIQRTSAGKLKHVVSLIK